MNYKEKIETLLNQAEAAFELTQDGLTRPEEMESLWQRGNYRLALAQAYTGLAQVANIENGFETVKDMVSQEGTE